MSTAEIRHPGHSIKEWELRSALRRLTDSLAKINHNHPDIAYAERILKKHVRYRYQWRSAKLAFSRWDDPPVDQSPGIEVDI